MRTVNQNLLPRPGSLSTPISPPIRPTSSFAIASPSPVPPYSRVVELWACAKGSKMRACCSGLIPIPVSATSKRSVTVYAA